MFFVNLDALFFYLKPSAMRMFLFSFLSLTGFSLFAQHNTFDANRVMNYFQDQEFDDAIRYLQPIADNDSTNVIVLSNLAYAYNMTDRPNAAAVYYKRVLSIDSVNISANQNLARLYANKNDSLAELLTSRLIRLQPQRALHYRSMGYLLDRRKQKDSATIFFEAAYRLDSNDTKNISALADILIDTKKYPRADSLLAIGIAIDSMYTPFLISVIRSAYDNEKYENAILPGRRLIQQQDVTIKPLTQLILSYYHLNRYTECIDACEYLRQQEIETEAVKYYEAKAWSKLGDYSRSNELLRECLESAISERAEVYYYALADNYEEIGSYSRAIAHYDTAYYLFKAPLVQYNLGRIYESKLKNPVKANKYFKNYLMLADTSTPDEKKVYHYLNDRYRKYDKNKKAH
jgi:tetratricopeptide (TPR) repeat protein